MFVRRLLQTTQKELDVEKNAHNCHRSNGENKHSTHNQEEQAQQKVCTEKEVILFSSIKH